MKNQDIIDRLRTELVSRYDVDPAEIRTVRSPYRICPLGAHVDHQLGPVTAMAIDRAVHLAFVPSRSSEVRLSSFAFAGEVAFSLDDIPDRIDHEWGNYARGAASALLATRQLDSGILGVTAGSMGEGGLSSSAAIDVAYLLTLEDANGFRVTDEENIELDRVIENEYLGLRNGVLDQSAILLSRQDQLTLLDCRTRKHERISGSSKAIPIRYLLRSQAFGRLW
jgi:galacturonokinase